MSLLKRFFSFVRNLKTVHSATVSSFCVRFSLDIDGKDLYVDDTSGMDVLSANCQDTPTLQVVQRCGHYFALDNARLLCLRGFEREGRIKGVRLEVVAAKQVPDRVLLSGAAPEIELVELSTSHLATGGLRSTDMEEVESTDFGEVTNLSTASLTASLKSQTAYSKLPLTADDDDVTSFDSELDLALSISSESSLDWGALDGASLSSYEWDSDATDSSAEEELHGEADCLL